MRVDPTFSSTVIADIQQSSAALQKAYEQVSTGLRISTPSDNPAATAAYMTLQAHEATVDQYRANADSVLAQMQTADSVLTSTVGLLNRALVIGTEGASSTSTADRPALASDIVGILSSVVSLANTTVGGVSLFGGSVANTTAFTPSPSASTGYTYNGNDSVNTVSVGDSLTVATNIPGDTLFTSPSASVLGALHDLATALSTGDSSAIGQATTSVTAALNYLSQKHAVYGSSINTLTSQEQYLSQEKVTISSQENTLVGIDTATAAEQLSQAELQNTTIYQASAKLLQNSLLSYLK